MSSDRPSQQIPPIFMAEVELAQQAAAEYQQSGDTTHLQTAIATWAKILSHPDFATADTTFQFAAYHDAAGAYFNHYGATNRLDDLQQAIAHLQQALTLAADDTDARAQCLSNLGGLLSQRYAHTGDEADLAAAIQTAEAAVQQTLPDSPDRAARLSNLGHGLSNRYSHTGNPEDLEQAIAAYVEALQQTPPDSPPMASRCNNLASVLQDRYHYSGDTTALDAALQAFEMAVNLTPSQSPHLSLYLNNLGNAFRTAYLNTGQLDSLDRAIHCAEQAIAQSPLISPDRAGYLNNLGNALRNRYEATGELTDLNRAVQAYEEAVETTTAGLIYRPMFLHNLAVGLRNRYFQAGHPEDLERAINYFEAAVQQSPTGSPELPGYLSTLGTALDDRYSQTGSLEDLDRAIATHRQAVAQTPTDAANLPIHLNNLGNALRNRHTRTRQFQDLESAIITYQQAVDRTPADSVYRASRLNNLANALRDRYTYANQLTDLEQAIQAYEAAIAVVPTDSTERAPIYNNMGNAQRDQFRHTRNFDTLNQAIAAYEQSFQLTPAQSPEYHIRQKNLANALKDYFTQTGDKTYLHHAQNMFKNAAIQVLEFSPEIALSISRDWSVWAVERQAWSESVDAYHLSLQAIDKVYSDMLEGRPGSLMSQGGPAQFILELAQGIPAQAAFALAKIDDLEQALEVLESGTARLMSESMNFGNSEAEGLQNLGYGDLANRYKNLVRKRLEISIEALQIKTKSLPEKQPIQFHNPDHQSLNLETSSSEKDFQKVLEELKNLKNTIQKIPGYQDFPKSPSFAPIKVTLQEYPLVYILATGVGGLAFILGSNNISVADLVWLPDLNEQAIQRYIPGAGKSLIGTDYLRTYRNSHQAHQEDEYSRETWFNALEEITQWLWQVLMGPLLEKLAANTRAILIPIGILRLLPLHAAWTEALTMPTGRCYALDQLTITYTPNSRTLTAAQEIANQVSQDYLLAIADPQPVKAVRLVDAEYEVAAAISAFPHSRVLKHRDATRSAILTMLPDYSVFHCSCHGHANLIEPLASGLTMSNNENLSLRDLLNLRLKGARLAILSACETGILWERFPDEVIGLPTGLLQVGFAGVVASLWPVLDISTTILMVRFYDLWRCENLPPPDALCQAQKWVRDTTNQQKYDYLKTHFQAIAIKQKISGQEVSNLLRDFMLQYIYEDGPESRSFAHLFHWAAFSYTGA
jgi:CHAT domain-containing protein